MWNTIALSTCYEPQNNNSGVFVNMIKIKETTRKTKRWEEIVGNLNDAEGATLSLIIRPCTCRNKKNHYLCNPFKKEDKWQITNRQKKESVKTLRED
jgi:hypothetical protein